MEQPINSTESTGDEPAIATSLEMTGVVEEPSTGTAMDISAPTEAQTCGLEAGDVAAGGVIDEPTVNGAVGVDEEVIQSSTEAVGKANSSEPGTSVVDGVSLDVAGEQTPTLDAEVEPVDDVVVEQPAAPVEEVVAEPASNAVVAEEEPAVAEDKRVVAAAAIEVGIVQRRCRQ